MHTFIYLECFEAILAGRERCSPVSNSWKHVHLDIIQSPVVVDGVAQWFVIKLNLLCNIRNTCYNKRKY